MITQHISLILTCPTCWMIKQGAPGRFKVFNNSQAARRCQQSSASNRDGSVRPMSLSSSLEERVGCISSHWGTYYRLLHLECMHAFSLSIRTVSLSCFFICPLPSYERTLFFDIPVARIPRFRKVFDQALDPSWGPSPLLDAVILWSPGVVSPSCRPLAVRSASSLSVLPSPQSQV